MLWAENQVFHYFCSFFLILFKEVTMVTHHWVISRKFKKNHEGLCSFI